MASLTWAVVLLAGLASANAVGNQIQIEDWTSVVQVEFRLATTWRSQCVGSIITNYHVLSAASCFPSSPVTRRIRAGSDEKAFGGVLRSVDTISNHPNFGSAGNDADISVIRVDLSFWFTSSLGYISIVASNFFIPANVELELAGWGVTAEGGVVGNSFLHKASVLSKDLPSCLSIYGSQASENMICVGLQDAPGRDFDFSDTGAPLIFDNTLVGVASFGKSSSQDQFPIAASAVSVYSNWIVQQAV